MGAFPPAKSPSWYEKAPFSPTTTKEIRRPSLQQRRPSATIKRIFAYKKLQFSRPACRLVNSVGRCYLQEIMVGGGGNEGTGEALIAYFIFEKMMICFSSVELFVRSGLLVKCRRKCINTGYSRYIAKRKKGRYLKKNTYLQLLAYSLAMPSTTFKAIKRIFISLATSQK